MWIRFGANKVGYAAAWVKARPRFLALAEGAFRERIGTVQPELKPIPQP